jgi:hypothetical protein
MRNGDLVCLRETTPIAIDGELILFVRGQVMQVVDARRPTLMLVRIECDEEMQILICLPKKSVWILFRHGQTLLAG